MRWISHFLLYIYAVQFADVTKTTFKITEKWHLDYSLAVQVKNQQKDRLGFDLAQVFMSKHTHTQNRIILFCT